MRFLCNKLSADTFQIFHSHTHTEVGIYKRKQESKKEGKHAFDQESDHKKKRLRSRKKERKHAHDQESKIQEKTLTITQN